MQAVLLESMGNDLTVVNAARVSFAKCKDEFEEKDARLIRYLATHNHWTPFAHVTASFRVSAPVFVRSQLLKHVVGLVCNEVSRRYVNDLPAMYAPEKWRKAPESAKQGSGGTHPQTTAISDVYTEWCYDAIRYYQQLIKSGVAPEQARMVLPQSMMTEWIWTGSLAAFARVCKQRISGDAQEETRFIAEDISDQLSGVAPVSWAVLTSG